MKRHRPQNGDESRNIRTIVQFILKISNYEEAYQALFGETPDCITPEEQQILNHSPYVVSEMFNKVKTPEEGGVAGISSRTGWTSHCSIILMPIS